MYRKTILALAGLLLIGCAKVTSVPLAESTAKSLQGRTVSVVKRETPSFTAMTAGKASFGVFGQAAMVSAGNAIVKENDIADPAAAISIRIQGAIKDHFAVTISDQPAKPNGSDPIQICSVNPGADLILDVGTIHWAFTYFPSNWSHYRVLYGAAIRLIDAKSRKVLAEGVSARVPQEVAGAPTKEELLADHAKLLKAELDKGAEQCIQEFLTKVLNLPATPEPVPAVSPAAGAVPAEAKPAA